MRPNLPANTQAMGLWSFNTSRQVHDAINVQTLATLASAIAAGHGLTLVDPPTGHANPETTKREVAARRFVVDVAMWFRTGAAGLDCARLNDAMAGAIIDAGYRGTDFSRADLKRGLDTCTNIARWYDAPLLPWNWIPIGGDDTSFATVCADYRPYQGTPPTAGLNGTLANLTAQPVNDSNNVNRIGEEPTLFRLPGIGGVSSSELRTVGYITLGVGALFAVGYAVRSFRFRYL